MKKLLLLLAVMMLLVPQAPAAFTPVAHDVAAVTVQPGVSPAVYPRWVKSPFVQKVTLKLAQQKWFQKWMRKANEKQRTKDNMGTIALVAGILMVLSMLVFPVASLVLAPVAIVTGIIGISKNPNRRSYTKALIGLILGLVWLLVLLVLLAVAVAWSSGW